MISSTALAVLYDHLATDGGPSRRSEFSFSGPEEFFP